MKLPDELDQLAGASFGNLHQTEELSFGSNLTLPPVDARDRPENLHARGSSLVHSGSGQLQGLLLIWQRGDELRECSLPFQGAPPMLSGPLVLVKHQPGLVRLGDCSARPLLGRNVAVSEERRCPICGQGVLKHLGTEAGRDLQEPESPIRETYTCGHEVLGPTLGTADADRLEVERRRTDETIDPETRATEEGAAG